MPKDTLLSELFSEIESRCLRMRKRLLTLQNADGGFKGFYCYDKVSGVWSTAEVIHMLSKDSPSELDLDWIRLGCEYLVQAQNEDGGWPFRKGGKSITDISAWCCLALSNQNEYINNIERGIEFILNARENEGSDNEAGWGLTSFEPDRIYSTWIASYCISRLLRRGQISDSVPLGGKMLSALREAREWIISAMHEDGSWSATRDSSPSHTSTAVALLTLFIQGDNPVEFRHSCKFLLSGLEQGLWHAEDEIVITREGYELPQQWFTSTLCFRAMIFFAELGVLPLSQLNHIYECLLTLVGEDGNVSVSPRGPKDMIWPIPYMLDALTKYKLFIRSKPEGHQHFLEKKYEEQLHVKKRDMQHRLETNFPYPVSQLFFTYQHELDFHRKFQLTLQLYEVAIKYACIVVLSGYLLNRDQSETVTTHLIRRFPRPSLGDWSNLLELLFKHSQGLDKLLHPMKSRDVVDLRSNYLEDTGAKKNLSQAMAAIVSLRNTNTGHGALRSMYEYKLMVEDEMHRLYSFFESLGFPGAWQFVPCPGVGIR